VFLYLAQAVLIATDRRALHRSLGVASIALAALMIVTGYETTIELTRRGFDLSGDLHLRDPLMNAVFPLGDLFTSYFSARVCGIATIARPING